MTLRCARYRVDLPALQAVCEANYWRLMRLLPQMRTVSEPRALALSYGPKSLGTLRIAVCGNNPYTTTLQLVQESTSPWLPVPYLEVRVYHDACMAEVVGTEAIRYVQPVYPYPNPLMHQPDEKAQLNTFLAEWLGQCFSCGHEPLPVI